MSRGGARSGAGRPAGSSNKKKAADAATERLKTRFKDQFDEDILEQDAIDTVEFARMYFMQAFRDGGDPDDLKASVACARDSLPYKLPKLTANKTDLSVSNSYEHLSDEELNSILTDAREADDDARPH